MKKWIEVAVGAALVCVIAGVAWRLAASRVELDIYRDRLSALSRDYESLRATYNEAVARTAVTELVVRDGRLSVAVRTIQGVERVIETPFDPAREIYCDYVLLGGRLWIRRVYDAQTPPDSGLLIDDTLRRVDWKAPGTLYGKAVYRTLDEGRWIVTVTGDGSLGLVKVAPGAEVAVSPPPPVRDYEQLKKQIDDDLAVVTTGEVLKRFFAPGK